MTIMVNIENEYYEWLCSKIIDDTYYVQYSKLMSHLYDSIFTPVMDMDINRAEDGKSLRHRFGLDNDISENIIIDCLDNKEYCNMLEMMVALSIRCEEGIMSDEWYGDRTGTWFWNMIVSLGLGTMNDSRFDERYTNIVLRRFMNRQYEKNGEGGLFTINGLKQDLRSVEIWYQMCWYLDSL